MDVGELVRPTEHTETRIKQGIQRHRKGGNWSLSWAGIGRTKQNNLLAHPINALSLFC